MNKSSTFKFETETSFHVAAVENIFKIFVYMYVLRLLIRVLLQNIFHWKPNESDSINLYLQKRHAHFTWKLLQPTYVDWIGIIVLYFHFVNLFTKIVL